MIRSAVGAARYADPAAAALLAEVLIARRDKIAAAYLPAINPLVDFTLTAGGQLAFRNAAVDARVAMPPAGGYSARWSELDNATGTTRSLGPATTSANEIQAPGPLPSAPGAVVQVLVSAVGPAREEWAVPIDASFRRTADGWRLVGLVRKP